MTHLLPKPATVPPLSPSGVNSARHDARRVRVHTRRSVVGRSAKPASSLNCGRFAGRSTPLQPIAHMATQEGVFVFSHQQCIPQG